MTGTSETARPAPEAELWTAPGCPHCPRVRAALERLRAAGEIGALTVHDVAREADRARALGIRAVPWLRLGPLELEGLHTEGELREWARAAGTVAGRARYVEAELVAGRLEPMLRRARAAPGLWVPALLRLLEAEETDLKARFGVAALLEQLAAEGALAPWIDALGALTRSVRPALRADAAHYLGLTRAPSARPWLERLLADDHPDVREIAAESLASLGAAPG